MNDIVYRQLNPIIEQEVMDSFGGWAMDYLHTGEGCHTLVALDGDKPVGFISTYPLQYPEPLEYHNDAYIDVLEVAEGYRRRGIAGKLVGFSENWAREYGYKQIRAWSSDDKIEAIRMWYALDYCICPAWMRGYSAIKGYEGIPINGFYVAKVLNHK